MKKKMSTNAPAEIHILSPLEDIAKVKPETLGRILPKLDILAEVELLVHLPEGVSAQIRARREEALRHAAGYTKEQLTSFDLGYNCVKDIYRTKDFSEHFDWSRLPHASW